MMIIIPIILGVIGVFGVSCKFFYDRDITLKQALTLAAVVCAWSVVEVCLAVHHDRRLQTLSFILLVYMLMLIGRVLKNSLKRKLPERLRRLQERKAAKLAGR
jgi:hypothetical protein